jgi:hypothetical protein
MVRSFKKNVTRRVNTVVLREVFTTRGFQTRKYSVVASSSTHSSPKKTPQTNDDSQGFLDDTPYIEPLRLPANTVHIILLCLFGRKLISYF